MLINLTPHPITIRPDGADEVVLPPSGQVARVAVAQAAARLGRTDVVSPDTGPTAIRDEEGRIVAVRRLQTWA